VRIELGKRLPGKVEIAKGLTADMQIITGGQMRLRDGSALAIKKRATVQTSALPVVLQ
jgi:membrane fusion protein (multidrug efflux system)